MCGIAGFYTEKNVFHADELLAMTNSLKHRGPDAEGSGLREPVSLDCRQGIQGRVQQPL